MKGENWEGAELEITKVDEPPAKIFRSVSVAYSATRHGCRAAALVGNIIDGFVVRVDGKEGPRFEDIREETPLFSANGQAVAYCAQKDGKWRWVIDEVEGPAFQTLTATSFAFSADGKRHAYVATLGFGPLNVLVLDGKIVAGGEAGKPIPWDAAPLFSPDGRRFAYVETVAGKPVMRVVLDGKPGPWNHDGGIGMRQSSGFGAVKPETGLPAKPNEFGFTFSADSKHFAYSEFVREGRRHVIDGVPGSIYKNLGIDFALPPHGSDYAYMAYPDGQRAIVRRTAKPLPIEALADGTLTFSPDGKHLAFVGIRGGQRAIWLDGKAHSEVKQNYHFGAPRFSPNSKRLAYPLEVQSDGTATFHWVVDGKAGPAAEHLDFDHFNFSPDSGHHCYIIPTGKRDRLSISSNVAFYSLHGIVVDGKIRATHPYILCAAFRNDGSLEYLAHDEDKQLFRFRVTGY